MKIKYFLFLLIILIPNTLFGQDPVKYKKEFITGLSAGFGESGKLYIIETSHSLRPSQPVIYGKKLVVNNRAENEFVFYTTQGAVLDAVKNDEVFLYASYIGVFNNGDIFAISERGFSRRKWDGSSVYLSKRIPPNHLFYPETATYWLYGDYLIYTERETGVDYQIIDGEGHHLNPEQRDAFFKRERFTGDAVNYSNILKEKIDDFLIKNNVALAGNQLLSFDTAIYSEYLALILENITGDQDKLLWDEFPHLDRNQIIFLQNGYVLWKYNSSYYLYSPLGELIEQFSINGSNDYPFMLANNGYWYWLEIDYGVFNLYRFKPNWSDEVLTQE